MEKLKNEFISELINQGFSPDEAVRALKALATTLQGYNISPKDSNLATYDSQTVADKLVKMYINCKIVEGCSKGYIKNINTLLPRLFEFTNQGPKEISSFGIRAFLADWQMQRGISGRTLETYRIMINAFFVWLNQEGYMDKNPCSSIKPIRTEQKQRESLSPMELEIVRSSLQNLREKVLIEVLFSTGCRAAEFCGIKLSDIDFESRTIKVYGKGKKERIVPLSPKAIVTIKAYLNQREYTSEYLYENTYAPHGAVKPASIQKDIRRIEARCQGQLQHHLHPHIIRHTTATIAMSNGMPVQEIQLMLGHSRIDTTMIYAETNIGQMLSNHSKCIA